ncbi:MAG: polysaccharide deacetylase family protein [Microbacterium sp.]|uniref:polysaccharide deacetylase family protein n=1 Tax=Microbacterium sp. TaxID=51671 RepID=UPI0039E4004B
MTRRDRLTRAAALLAGAALILLAGCAPEPESGWTPAAWSNAAVTVTTMPDPVDATTVADLEGQRIRNDTVGIQARWMQLPGDASIDARLTQVVRDAVSAQASAAGAAYAPAVFPQGTGLADRTCVDGSTLRAGSELLADAALGPADGTGTAVACDVVAAAGTFFGERLRVVTGSGGTVTADATTVLYTDTATGEVVSADQLWTDAAAGALWDDVVDALRRQAGALSLATVAPATDDELAAVRAALAQTVVAADGSLVFTLPAGFTAPALSDAGIGATTEPVTIGVSPAASAGLVTDFATGLMAAAGTAYQAPAAVAAGFEAVDCTLVPCVAMTYDDGPSDWTPQILDAVAAHHAAVTFFAMGQKAATYATTMQRALAEGNLVENHTWDHPHLTTLTAAEVTAQIQDTTAAITAATGTAPTVFRPPYGQYDSTVLAAAGMAAITWDVDSLDWTGLADDALTERVVDGPSPGSIVLQHDIQQNTIRTVSAVYDGLADRGFTIVNLKQLFGGTLPTSGVWSDAR